MAAVLVQPDGATIDSVGLTADCTLAGFPRLRGRRLSDAGVASPVPTGPAGAAVAYRRRAWERVGGLDDEIFMYGEDLELAVRLSTAGWETAFAADAVAVHHGSATSGRRSRLSRYHGGFSRGHVLRRYRILRRRPAFRAAVPGVAVCLADAVVSHHLATLRGHVSGWRAAGSAFRYPHPPRDATDGEIGFVRSLRLRRESR